MRLKRKSDKGFIALISAIIISVLLLIITVTISMTGIFGRFNVLDSESKERSLGLAEACADKAILDIAQYTIPSPLPTSPITVDTIYPNDTCIIYAIDQTIPGEITIKTQAYPNKAYTNLIVVIDNNDFTIKSWTEIPTL